MPPRLNGLDQIINTSGGATLITIIPSNVFQDGIYMESTVFIQAVYTLNAGTTYVFDIQGATAGGGFIIIEDDIALSICLQKVLVYNFSRIKYYYYYCSINLSWDTRLYDIYEWNIDSSNASYLRRYNALSLRSQNCNSRSRRNSG